MQDTDVNPSEPTRQPFRSRSMLVMGVLLMGYALLAGRLAGMQHGDSPARAGLRKRVVERQARRGTVTDARGRPVAVSVAVESCAIDPLLLRNAGRDVHDVLGQLDAILQFTPAETRALIQRAHRENSRFVWIRRHLDEEQASAIRDLKLPGVLLQQEYKRRYPFGTLGAHLIGFTDIDGKGREGIEALCNAVLSGDNATRTIMRDAIGRSLAVDGSPWQSDTPPLDVELTFDASLQTIAEEELAKTLKEFRATQGTAVVMDPCTGDVLALVSLPHFDPNHPADSPAENRFNFAIGGTYEPGSIFKTPVTAAALESRVVTPETTFYCENKAWRMPENGRILRDTHPHGTLTVSMILAKSSNIGMAKKAAKMGPKTLHDHLAAFGFGQRTGQPLPGEVTGTLRPVSRWTSYSMGSIPMGQEVAVTPIQIVTAYSALANGGMLLRPRLIRRIHDGNGHESYDVPITPVRRVVRPDVAQAVLGMLEKAVDEGTGRRVRMDEYRIGGKTGTAQMMANAQERAAGHRGYSPNRYVSSFVGVVPIENPRLVILVSIWEPQGAYYGGTVAGPAVREIARRSLRYLKVPHSSKE